MSYRVLLLAALAGAACACNGAPGRPAPDSAVIAPDKVVDFDVLYATNCAGCHGANGTGGAAIGLADPVYLAIADDATIRRVVLGQDAQDRSQHHRDRFAVGGDQHGHERDGIASQRAG